MKLQVKGENVEASENRKEWGKGSLSPLRVFAEPPACDVRTLSSPSNGEKGSKAKRQGTEGLAAPSPVPAGSSPRC